jgi:hypothetical protein
MRASAAVKAPLSFDVMNIAVAQPCDDLALEAAAFRDAPIEALSNNQCS